MTQSREPNDRDLFTRIAQIEYRLTQVENIAAQLQDTIAPGGYVTDAFERVVDRIDEVEDRINARMDERFDELNGKIDLILRGITGLGNS
jgi:translation initiation factor 1 (eIF-1/SUI1)